MITKNPNKSKNNSRHLKTKNDALIILIMWTTIKKFIRKHKKTILYSLGVATISYLAYSHFFKTSEIKLSAFLKAVKEGYVEQVMIKGQKIVFRSAKDQWFTTFYQTFPRSQILRTIREQNIMYSFKQQNIKRKVLVMLAQGLISIGTLRHLRNLTLGDPIADVDFQAKTYNNNCHFSDFYGGQLVKTKFKETISFLKNPQRFEQLSARVRRGILLYGPPGTGKTLLARALANEANCEFIKAAASEFQEIFVGIGAKRVRQLFKEAKKHENGCIIFIDEIDALGSRQKSLRDTSETTSTVTQFLSEMDGFKPLDKVIVVASTNRIDLVDPAVLRSGRFDIKIQISLPGREERVGILKTLIDKKLKQHQIKQQTIQELGDRLEGCSGADIEAILNESVYKAIREQHRLVQSVHLEESAEQMLKIA